MKEEEISDASKMMAWSSKSDSIRKLHRKNTQDIHTEEHAS